MNLHRTFEDSLFQWLQMEHHINLGPSFWWWTPRVCCEGRALFSASGPGAVVAVRPSVWRTFVYDLDPKSFQSAQPQLRVPSDGWPPTSYFLPFYQPSNLLGKSAYKQGNQSRLGILAHCTAAAMPGRSSSCYCVSFAWSVRGPQTSNVILGTTPSCFPNPVWGVPRVLPTHAQADKDLAAGVRGFNKDSKPIKLWGILPGLGNF